MTTFTTKDKLNALPETPEVIQGASGAQYQPVDLTQFYKPLAEIPKQPVSTFTQAQQNEIKTLLKESIQEILDAVKKQN
jgi:hypothetical protein